MRRVFSIAHGSGLKQQFMTRGLGIIRRLRDRLGVIVDAVQTPLSTIVGLAVKRRGRDE